MRHSLAGTALATSLAFLVTGTALGAIKTKKEAATFSGKVQELRRSLFSGNEARFAQFGWLRPDCSSITPDIRIVSPPKNGKVHFEQAQSVATASTSAVQKKCYGKPVDEIVVYYRSDEKFIGRDEFMIDVDSKLGQVFRYTFLVDIDTDEPGRLKVQSSQRSPPNAEIVRGLPVTRLDRSVFRGNEARIAALNYVNADCSSGPIPGLRIVTPPTNGEYRLEETSIPLDRPPDNSRAACNGKPVSALAIYYTAKAEFTGSDEMVIDVDFKNGSVRRFVYAITVR
jgi:hypothetical protein